MGRFVDPRMQKWIEEEKAKDQKLVEQEKARIAKVQQQLDALKPKDKSEDSWSAIASSTKALMDFAGGAKKYGKLSKNERKKVAEKFQEAKKKEEAAKQSKIKQLEKELTFGYVPSTGKKSAWSVGGPSFTDKLKRDNLLEAASRLGVNTSSKPTTSAKSSTSFLGSAVAKSLATNRSYEEKYFQFRSNETKKMVENAVAYDPNKFGMKVLKDKKGNVTGYEIVNKQKQAEMNAALAKAKNKKEIDAIAKKYGPLTNYKIEDPLYGYTSVRGSNPQWSNGNQRTLLAPVILDRMLQGKPGLVKGSGTATLESVGIKAKATTGGNGFFSGTPLGGLAKSIGGAISGVSSATSKILSGAAKPVSTAIKTIGKGTEKIVASAAKGDVKGLAKAGLNVVEGAKDVAKQTASAGLTTALAPTGAIAGAAGIKPLEKLTQNIEREGQKGIEQYGDIAADIGANVATGGTYGAAKTLATGLSQGGIGYLESLATPEVLAKLGAEAAASQYGIDPKLIKASLAASQGDLVAAGALYSGFSENEAQMASSLAQGDITEAGALAAGLNPELVKSTLKGDLKGAALQGLGSYGGLNPEQFKMATSLAQGNITEAGALAAGLNPDMVKNITSGNLTGALTAGLTGVGAAQALASQAGIQPDIMQKAIDIGKSAMSGDLKKQALAQLGSYAGLAPNQMSLIQAASAGNLEQEAMSQAGQAAGLTNEQIQLGRSIASGDTKGLMNMAKKYTIGKGDTLGAIAKKYGMSVEDFMAANPQLKNANSIIAGAKLNIPGMQDQLESTAPIVNETVEQYAERLGLDSNVILEMNKGKGLSLTKPFPRGFKVNLPQGFTPPKVGEGSKGIFSSIGEGLSSAWEGLKGAAGTAGGAIASAAGKAKDFVAENKDLINTGVQAGSAYLGYRAGEEASEEAKKLAQQQLKEIQAQGQPFMKMTFDPERYKQERAFLQERIARGGLTKEEEALQKQGDIRAARAAAAARKAGVEQQARLGGAAMGTSALASSLAGSQALLGEQSQTNLAREQAAAKNLESAIQRQGGLSTQQTKEEADLAQSQGTFGLNRATQAGGVRGDLGNLAMGRATALQNLYGKGADLAAGALNRMEVPKPAAQPAPAAQPQQPPPAQNLSTKAGGAKRITTKPVTTKPSIPKNPQEAFNLANTYIKKPEQAVTDVKKIATDLGKEKVKELVPESISKFFNF